MYITLKRIQIYKIDISGFSDSRKRNTIEVRIPKVHADCTTNTPIDIHLRENRQEFEPTFITTN